MYLCFVNCYPHHWHLPSFPTRRSSDLVVIPNFYVSYENNPAPLSAKQKSRLSFRLLVDPTTIAAAGVAAGIQQAKNSYWEDRKSTRLNSSHQIISYAVFCLKKKQLRTI